MIAIIEDTNTNTFNVCAGACIMFISTLNASAAFQELKLLTSELGPGNYKLVKLKLPFDVASKDEAAVEKHIIQVISIALCKSTPITFAFDTILKFTV